MERPGRKRARGAVSSPKARYLEHGVEVFDDGWGTVEEPPPERVATEVRSERARSIITRNQSPDIPFSASINPYKGCEHGCIYCYARPSHAYMDLSPGLDFETKLAAKDNAPDVLVGELRKKSYTPEVVTIGANTDPYQPVERERLITRRLLETLLDSRHPVALITKSALVLRDLDLLSELAAHDLVQVFLSITTLDTRLSRIMEPRAASPARRLETVRQLRGARVPVGVMAAPMIPAINDSELDSIVEAAANAGAQSCSYILVRLPLEIKELFEAWLQEHFPDRKDRVLGLIRQTRGGKLYDSRFGARMRGQGVYAELLGQRFEMARRRHGLDGGMPPLEACDFRRPSAAGDQLSFDL